jgi:cation diffusion facilitator family transporter
MGNHICIDNTKDVRRVLIITLLLNLSVAAAKIFYGYLTSSISITSDGFHSMFDGASNIFGLIGIWIASHPPDKEHPYGHRKYETLFTIIIALMIFGTCFQILEKVYLSFKENSHAVVTGTSFAVMLITMGVNIFVARYEAARGRKLKSDFLIADAMHTKSDILTTISVIIGLVFVKLGYPVADSLAGLIIVLFIAKIGYEILRKSTDVLTDKISIDTTLIEVLVKKVEDVRGCHDVRTRGSESAAYVDLHIQVDPAMPIEKAHKIADRVEETICKEFPSVIDVVVHVEPEEG